LELPYDLLAYEHWLREQKPGTASQSSYLFLEPRVRFCPEPDDRLTLVNGVSLRREGKRAVLYHAATDTKAPVEGLDVALVERIISAIDGTHSLLAIQLLARATQSQMDVFLRASFGRFVLCPKTMTAFETNLDACGLVRFPGSPYEIDRYYWANMIAVRAAWLETTRAEEDASQFVRTLKRLHVLALIGPGGRTFYRPSSPIVNKAGARAGSFYEVPTRTLRELDLTLFVDGPRVSSPFVGGRQYHELLARSLSDPDALLAERQLVDDTGLGWGRVTVGLARSDAAPDSWFIPPRPITAQHLEQLHRNYAEARSDAQQSEDDWLRAVATFHYQFVRLHPFTCANQSLAMNLVNGLLERHARTAIPHLILDQLALRLSRDAYVQLFRRVVGAWSLSSRLPEARLRTLIEQRASLDGLVSRIGKATTLEAAERVTLEEPLAARYALLTDE
jgi:hypothetical protein